MKKDFVLRVKVVWFGTALALGWLFAGCAWDNSPPPLHSVLRFERNGSDMGWAAGGSQSGTNIVTGSEWDTNKIQGVGGGIGSPGGSIIGGNSSAVTTTPSGLGSSTTTRTSTGITTIPSTTSNTTTAAPTSAPGVNTTTTPGLVSPLGTSSSVPGFKSSAPTFGTSRTNALGLPQ